MDHEQKETQKTEGSEKRHKKSTSTFSTRHKIQFLCELSYHSHKKLVFFLFNVILSLLLFTYLIRIFNQRIQNEMKVHLNGGKNKNFSGNLKCRSNYGLGFML